MRFSKSGLKAVICAAAALGLGAPVSAVWAQDSEELTVPGPNYRIPSLYRVDEDGVEAFLIVGQGAWGDTIATLAALREIGPERDAAIIEQLWRERDTNPPLFLFEVARRAVATQPDLALEAYMLGRVRTIYDASRCLDSTAIDVVDVATQYAGEAVIDVMAERLSTVPAMLEGFLSNGDAFASQASPWWACSFSDSVYLAAVNGAPMTGPEWLKVEAVWPSIQADVSENVQANATLVRAAVENGAAQ